jgi:hypothetical protein
MGAPLELFDVLLHSLELLPVLFVAHALPRGFEIAPLLGDRRLLSADAPELFGHFELDLELSLGLALGKLPLFFQQLGLLGASQSELRARLGELVVFQAHAFVGLTRVALSGRRRDGVDPLFELGVQGRAHLALELLAQSRRDLELETALRAMDEVSHGSRRREKRPPARRGCQPPGFPSPTSDDYDPVRIAPCRNRAARSASPATSPSARTS